MGKSSKQCRASPLMRKGGHGMAQENFRMHVELGLRGSALFCIQKNIYIFWKIKLCVKMKYKIKFLRFLSKKIYFNFTMCVTVLNLSLSF